MARPRRPFNGMETIRPADTLWMQDEVPGSLGTRQSLRWESSVHWAYKQPNGQFDPLTNLFVLDMVMNIDPDIELRASKAAEWLNLADNSLTWDAVTVGKVLADLCDTFEDVLGEKMGLLERGRDYKSAFYRIHRNPETAGLAIRLREDLYRLTKLEMVAVENRNRSPRLQSPLIECPAARGEWTGEEMANNA